MAMAALIKKSRGKAFVKKHKKECTFDEEDFMDQVSKNTISSPAALHQVLQKEVDVNRRRARQQNKKYVKPRGPTPEEVATNPFVVQYLKEQQEMLTTERSKYFYCCDCEDDIPNIASPNDPEDQVAASDALPKDLKELNLSVDSASDDTGLFGPISDSSGSDNETQDTEQDTRESVAVSTVPAEDTTTEASVAISITEDTTTEASVTISIPEDATTEASVAISIPEDATTEASVAISIPEDSTTEASVAISIPEDEDAEKSGVDVVAAAPVENVLVQNSQGEMIMMQFGTPSEDQITQDNQESIGMEVVASEDQTPQENQEFIAMDEDQNQNDDDDDLFEELP